MPIIDKMTISGAISFTYNGLPYRYNGMSTFLLHYLEGMQCSQPIQLKVINKTQSYFECQIRWITDIEEAIIKDNKRYQSLYDNTMENGHFMSKYKLHLRKLIISIPMTKVINLWKSKRIELIPYNTSNPPKITVYCTVNGVAVPMPYEIPYMTSVHGMIAMQKSDFAMINRNFRLKRPDNHYVTSLICNDYNDCFVPSYISEELQYQDDNLNTFNTMLGCLKETAIDHAWTWVSNDKKDRNDRQLIGGKIQYVYNGTDFVLEYHIDTLKRKISSDWLVPEHSFDLELQTYFNLKDELLAVCFFKLKK
jgi:hypothetical protein